MIDPRLLESRLDVDPSERIFYALALVLIINAVLAVIIL